MPYSATGTQYRIASGSYRATICQVGATLRELTFKDRDIVVPFPEDSIMIGHRGAVIAPFPNRIADGRYQVEGKTIKMSLTDPDRHNAIHGFVSFLPFSLVDQSADSVTLRHHLYPSPEYPFDLVITVNHKLSAKGLTTTVAAENMGKTAAPYGVCPHPYLVAGPGHVNEWELHVPADTYLEVTPDRLLPVGTRSVDGTEKDFRNPHLVGEVELDHAYTDVHRDADGKARVEVRHGKTGAGALFGPDCKWVQVHTADHPDKDRNRIGMAVEPMTCPPDAFNSGIDLVHIQPDTKYRASWTLYGIQEDGIQAD